MPETRFNEIKAFVERGLKDFSVSRLKEKMPWGVPVPGDDDHVMYVWFDALVNYISAIGWPNDMEKFESWWPVLQFSGKDNLRQQSAMWQAMLMSAGLSPSRQIVIHGHVTSEGQKMSKSIGNVANPLDIIEEYGTDALRYYLAREISSVEDGDYTPERFKETYNANLANGLGNLVSRILKMAETNLENPVDIPEPKPFDKRYSDALDEFRLDKATDFVWEKIGELDSKIQETQPFKLVKEDKEKAVVIIKELLVDLYWIARLLSPFMPETSDKIKELIKENKSPDQPLFIRK